MDKSDLTQRERAIAEAAFNEAIGQDYALNVSFLPERVIANKWEGIMEAIEAALATVEGEEEGDQRDPADEDTYGIDQEEWRWDEAP